jgi:anti-sigma factor ChrR (cupin superfamily)
VFINADFGKRAVVKPGDIDWIASPMNGVERTACVEYGGHRPEGGEEIFMLRGALEDEMGVYPEGTWLRSPHGFEISPFSHEGCLLYCKAGHLPG